MSRFLFINRRIELLSFCKTEKDIEFLDTLFLIFHQIFLYRLQNIELDLSQYTYLKADKIDSFEESYQMTLYMAYQNIINSTLSESILEKNFSIFNSYEKISFSSFVQIAQQKIPWFDILQFWILLKEQDPDEKLSLDMRLIEDFTLTPEWFEYMDSERGKI